MGGARLDGRVERGNQTRQLVLGRAVHVASTEGLEGLSLGRLATELKLSKSGVFALFGSKEELQLATVRAAVTVFVEHVLTPTRAAPPGLGRVWRMCESWLSYSQRRVFSGGCFFYATIAEFDSREGKVHDALASTQTGWVTFVEETVEEARVRGSSPRTRTSRSSPSNSSRSWSWPTRSPCCTATTPATRRRRGPSWGGCTPPPPTLPRCPRSPVGNDRTSVRPAIGPHGVGGTRPVRPPRLPDRAEGPAPVGRRARRSVRRPARRCRTALAPRAGRCGSRCRCRWSGHR